MCLPNIIDFFKERKQNISYDNELDSTQSKNTDDVDIDDMIIHDMVNQQDEWDIGDVEL